MSQELVYNILKKLGGSATTSQIRQQARQDFPDATLFGYTTAQLKKLKNYGIVDYNRQTKTWSIKSKLK